MTNSRSTAARISANAALLAILAGAVVSCTPSQPGDQGLPAEGSASTETWAALVEIPEPDLSNASPGVQDQVRRQRSEVLALQGLLPKTPDADPEELAESLFDLGLIYLTYELFEAAEACFVNADSLVEDFRFSYLRGYLLKMQGRLEPAAELFSRARALRPDYLPILIQLAETRLELGRTEDAAALYEEALRHQPTTAAAVAGLGEVAMGNGAYSQAVGHFEHALKLQPSATSLHYSLSQALRRTGDLERARTHLERRGDIPVRIEDPVLDPVAVMGESAGFYLALAGRAVENRLYEEAASAYRRALDYEPSNYGASRGLSNSLQQLGDTASAMTVLREALARGIGDEDDQSRRERSEIHRLLGVLLISEGRDAEAIAELRASLGLDADRLDARLRLANALARGGALKAAIGHYDRILQARPEHTQTLLRRAAALVNVGQGDDALRDYRAALDTDPESAEIRMRYAEALDYLGHDERADRLREEAQDLGTDARSIAALAEAAAARHASRGEYDEAIEQLGRALSHEPALVGARYRMASLLGHVGRLDEALVEFGRVLDTAPRHSDARRGQIQALVLGARYLEARDMLRQALEVFPRDHRLAHALARLLVAAPDPQARNGSLGLELASRVFQTTGDSASRETVAMAQAELGKHREAADLQRRLIAEIPDPGSDLQRARLEAYDRQQPWRCGPEEILEVLSSDAS